MHAPSSQYIEANYKTVAFKQHLLRAAIKSAVAGGKFVAVKSSYKLSEAEKKGPPKKKVRAARFTARQNFLHVRFGR